MSWHVMLDVADLHVKVQLLHYMCHGVWCDRCGRHGCENATTCVMACDVIDVADLDVIVQLHVSWHVV